MNSKYRLLSKLTLKNYASSNLYSYESGARFLLRRSKSCQPTTLGTQCLPLNLNWSQCSCYVRSCDTPVFSSSVFKRYYVSTPSDTSSPIGNEQPEKKPSLYQRFKTMYKDYWYVLLPVHLVTSAAWFGGFYYLASSGVDIVALLEKMNVSDTLINPLRNGHARTGYLAISYALYKIATPIRYTVTLGGTTLSINYLKKWGYIKPMPSKEELKIMIEDQKGILKERGQTFKDNMMQSLKPTERKKKP